MRQYIYNQIITKLRRPTINLKVYENETRAIKKDVSSRIGALEMWLYKKIPLQIHTTNVEVLWRVKEKGRQLRLNLYILKNIYLDKLK